ncbi:beta-fructofuranosidase [Streptococcus rupicaprae]|uniref:Sucrose-6-phosphate hydrolase n=1 Tax=Streptococcus rupicaprae TaxID=759619 RepID=A0ABV2FK84_9STRE
MVAIKRAAEYIAKQKSAVIEDFKPRYHLTPEVGWMNDPNGFIYFKGEYHLFYQYNPYDSVWGPMHWGHAKSKDLVNWEYLPVALAPDQPYDKDGCFSGSAIVKDDKLWLMYTGHIVGDDGVVTQVQNMAYSTDGVSFEKYAKNPVATADTLPDEIIANDFRDPKVFEHNGRYYAVVATKHRDNVGCIVLLGSEDLLTWRFESIFLKGEPHQGPVWECPDYFEIDGQSYLIMSPMRYKRNELEFVNLNSNVIVKGSVDWDTKTFVAESFDEIDHGHDFYAAQTTQGPNGERVMVAWMHTWGRTIIPHEKGHKWYGQMTLARILTREGTNISQSLPQTVIDNLPLLNLQNERDIIGQTSIEVVDSIQFKLGTSDDYLLFGVDREKQEVYIDRQHLKLTQVGEEEWDTTRRSVRLAAKTLTIVLDTNSLELFVNNGQESLSSTFYIEGDAELQVLKSS